MLEKSLKMLDEAISQMSEDEELDVLDSTRIVNMNGWHLQDKVLNKAIKEIEVFLSKNDTRNAKKKTEELIHDLRACLHQVDEARNTLSERESMYSDLLRKYESLRAKNNWK